MGRILLIAAGWTMRALVRAELLEEGYELQAWPTLDVAKACLMHGGELPQATILDTEGIEASAETLSDLWRLTGCAPLLLCGGLSSRGLLAQTGLPPARILMRPFCVGDVAKQLQEMVG